MVFTMAIGVGCCTIIRTDTIPPYENRRNVKLVEDIENATVAFLISQETDRKAYCAGVWIDKKRILTVNHCAEVIGRKILNISEETSYDATGDPIAFVNHSDADENGNILPNVLWLGKVTQVDKKRDLALITVLEPTSDHTIVSIVDGPIYPGESLHIIGHTIGLTWSYVKGNVSNIRNMQGPMTGSEFIISKVLQVSAPVWMGNSGGGAFDNNGNLVGICSWVTLKAPNISFFIHYNDIKDFLMNVNN